MEKPTSEEIQKRVKEGAMQLQKMLRGPGSEEALEFLRGVFDSTSPFVKGDAYETHVRVGEQNVVRYLQTVRDSEYDYE